MSDPTETRESLWGVVVPTSEWRPRRHVLSGPERTASGNIVFRIGQELPPKKKGVAALEGWEQIGVVVLTPEENIRMATQMVQAGHENGSGQIDEGEQG